jgi:hypothetical protein
MECAWHVHGHYASECPNKRIMMIRDNGDMESESDTSDCEGAYHWRIVMGMS